VSFFALFLFWYPLSSLSYTVISASLRAFVTLSGRTRCTLRAHVATAILSCSDLFAFSSTTRSLFRRDRFRRRVPFLLETLPCVSPDLSVAPVSRIGTVWVPSLCPLVPPDPLLLSVRLYYDCSRHLSCQVLSPCWTCFTLFFFEGTLRVSCSPRLFFLLRVGGFPLSLTLTSFFFSSVPFTACCVSLGPCFGSFPPPSIRHPGS